MIVLDVNAAITIAKGTEEGRTLRELMMEGEEVVAPHFFFDGTGKRCLADRACWRIG